ncbi:zinc finger protein 624-like [Microplitis mediator]|uniref:zinc finger protein 624-like n=1 Tax=Microplitis mediator TaxID=375433 RepID=UPI002553D8D9|nr:zinc finger protein 624-like [Microplitis mediator]
MNISDNIDNIKIEFNENSAILDHECHETTVVDKKNMEELNATIINAPIVKDTMKFFENSSNSQVENNYNYCSVIDLDERPLDLSYKIWMNQNNSLSSVNSDQANLLLTDDFVIYNKNEDHDKNNDFSSYLKISKAGSSSRRNNLWAETAGGNDNEKQNIIYDIDKENFNCNDQTDGSNKTIAEQNQLKKCIDMDASLTSVKNTSLAKKLLVSNDDLKDIRISSIETRISNQKQINVEDNTNSFESSRYVPNISKSSLPSALLERIEVPGKVIETSNSVAKSDKIKLTEVSFQSETNKPVDSEKHMHNHAEKTYECDICQKKFKRAGALTSHFKKHTGGHTERHSGKIHSANTAKDPITCDICKKTFGALSCLKQHMISHFDERPYECNICQYKFKRAGNLTSHFGTHIVKHTARQSCEIPPREFPRIHTARDPITCHICRKTFEHRCRLKEHMITHSEERPYECHICHSKFKRAGDLKSHLGTHIVRHSKAFIYILLLHVGVDRRLTISVKTNMEDLDATIIESALNRNTKTWISQNDSLSSVNFDQANLLLTDNFLISNEKEHYDKNNDLLSCIKITKVESLSRRNNLWTETADENNYGEQDIIYDIKKENFDYDDKTDKSNKTIDEQNQFKKCMDMAASSTLVKNISLADELLVSNDDLKNIRISSIETRISNQKQIKVEDDTNCFESFHHIPNISKSFLPFVLLQRIEVPGKVMEPSNLVAKTNEKKLTEVSFQGETNKPVDSEKPLQNNKPYRIVGGQSCKECGYLARGKYHLNIHMRKHSDEKSMQCPECPLKTAYKSHLILHMRRFHLDQMVSCKLCESKFITAYDLRKHMRIHTGNKCDICEKSFRQLYHLKQHMISHSEERPYECNICHNKFKRVDNLKNHLGTHIVKYTARQSSEIPPKELPRIHTAKDPITCDICKKTFGALFLLRRHMISHSEERPYECNICHNKFKRVDYLRTHLGTHIDKYTTRQSCEVPSREFPRIHTAKDLITCHICKKTFGQRFRLKRHMISHSEERPHECNICQKKFKRAGDLTSHLGRAHI